VTTVKNIYHNISETCFRSNTTELLTVITWFRTLFS